jgi:hypothetical protein
MLLFLNPFILQLVTRITSSLFLSTFLHMQGHCFDNMVGDHAFLPGLSTQTANEERQTPPYQVTPIRPWLPSQKTTVHPQTPAFSAK